jgi:nicotinate-nucleotide adenylyltransferase
MLSLDRVHFVPTFMQPLRPRPHAGSPQERLEMVRAAVAVDPRFVADSREIDRAGTSYTVDTLRSIRGDFPNSELSLLIGADTVKDLPRWHEWEELPQLASIVVLSRPGAKPPVSAAVASYLEVPEIDISATRIREKIRDGQPFRDLLPATVADYIEMHGLYGLGN